MNTKTNFFRSIFQALSILTLLVLVFAQAVSVSAQGTTPPAVSSYEKLPVKGQLIIQAGKGFVAPEQWHNLNVTLWYGVREDTVATMGNLGNGLAADRAKLYGGNATDYPTVVWSGPSVNVTGGNCREQFYSDAAVLTAGVVYGDECPILVEYNAENQPAIAEPAAAPESANPAYVAPVLPVVPTTSIPGVPEWFWNLVQWVGLGCFGLLFAMLAAYAAYMVIRPRHGSGWALGLAAVAFFISLIPCMPILVLLSLGAYSLIRPVQTVTISDPPR